MSVNELRTRNKDAFHFPDGLRVAGYSIKELTDELDKAKQFVEDSKNFAEQSAANLEQLSDEVARATIEADRAKASADTAVIEANKATLAVVSATNSPSTNSTSTSQVSYGVGSKTLMVQIGKAFVTGQFIVVANTADPTKYMSGQVSSYNPLTGELIFKATGSSIVSATSAASWTISISAPALAEANAGAVTATTKAAEAAASATTASTKAAEANASALAAATSQTSASNSATTATTKATEATSSANAAAASAVTANTKAAAANTSATAAATSETNSAANVTTATAKANAAASSATAAAASATEAANSATTANAKSVLATTSATTATTKAAEAANSAAIATAAASEAATSAATALNAPGTSATSTTQVTLSTGNITLTIQTGKLFAVGQFVIIADSSAPERYMTGQVTGYNSSNGQIVVNVDATSVPGGTSASSWIVSLTAPAISTTGSTSALTIDNKTAAYTVVASDLGKIINCTSGTFTVSLTAAATLGAGFNCWIWNTSGTPSDAITIKPAGSEEIDGATSLILRRGEGFRIICDGAGWQTGDKKAMRGYAENISFARNRPAALGLSSIAIGDSSTSLGDSALSFGPSTSALSNNSTALGRNSNSRGSYTITGEGATALGGSYASGTDSFAAAIANNTGSYGATGANSVAIGSQARAGSNQSCIAIGRSASASGGYCVAIGDNVLASGMFSLAIGGQSNSATGSYSAAIGGVANSSNGQYSFTLGAYNTAAGSFSFASGYFASSTIYGKKSFASGRFTSTGDAQSGKLIVRAITTDAVKKPLTSDGAVGQTSNQIFLPVNSSFSFIILVVAREPLTHAAVGYKFEGVATRDGANVSFIGTPAKTVLAESASLSNCDCDINVYSNLGLIQVQGTGETGKTINWVATCWTTEVTG